MGRSATRGARSSRRFGYCPKGSRRSPDSRPSGRAALKVVKAGFNGFSTFEIAGEEAIKQSLVYLKELAKE